DKAWEKLKELQASSRDKHSPLMISDHKGVVCYLLDDGKLTELEDLFGLDVNHFRG
ncbi:MAG: hypothetical protein HQK65_16685, partial [Desulfamplus sp.]|nr:hypothetical protein [Desulfamplus sp.]